MSILITDKIRKEYSSLVAVNDVCLNVEKGQIVGLIGPNGAGKTTLLRMLATVLPLTDGTAAICDIDLRKHPLEIRNKVGYLPDFFNLYDDLRLVECLEFFARAYGVPDTMVTERIAQSLEYVNLTSKKNSFIRHLSRGMVQRMGLAIQLVHEPEILLLDEPASGLDPLARIQLRDILKRLGAEGKTIIISSHILTELSGFCSHLAVMNQGKLVLHGEIHEIERQISGIGNIILKVLENADAARSLIESFPGATLNTCFDSTFKISVDKGPQGIAELNRFLVQNNIQIIHLSEEKTSLEDLFVEISKEQNLQIS